MTMIAAHRAFGFAIFVFVISLATLSLSCSKTIEPPVNSTVSTTPSPIESALPVKKDFKTGDAVPAGYLGYKVYASWFNDHPTPKRVKGPAPVGTYLVIDMSIANTDRKERAIPPLVLVDEQGKEYTPSEEAWKNADSFGQVGKLEPATSKRSFVIFEASKTRRYKLKLQGFSPSEVLTIELTPAQSAPG